MFSFVSQGAKKVGYTLFIWSAMDADLMRRLNQSLSVRTYGGLSAAENCEFVRM